MNIDGFGGTLLGRDHADFETSRFGWNAMIDRHPALIARCADTADVVRAVNHAREHGLKAVARGGGHSVSGASLPQDGIMIDLSAMNGVDVDPEARVAHVGGGALLGELDAATQAHGLAVTAGVEPSTGVGGLTLGGGIGILARKLGLTIDCLQSAEMVLADGSVVMASDESHPDLFWAIRGGGGQFGIVTRFDFRLHEIGPQVMSGQAFYPIDQAKDVLGFLDRYLADMPDDLSVGSAFLRVPPVEAFPAEWHGKPSIALAGCHFGDEETARAQLQPLLEQGEAILGFVAPMPYVDFQKTFADVSPKGGRYYWKSIFVDGLEDDLIEALAEAFLAIPGEYTMIFTEALGGAVSRVGVTETAFSNRTARFNLGISAGWIDPALDESAIAETRACYDRVAKYSDGTVYLNYLDRDEAARAEAGFGANYTRLCEIKNRYDPENLFGGPLGAAG